MRRSSRVILLLGIFLAVGAFIVIAFFGGGGRQGPTPTPAVATIVVAVVDIPQGTAITASMVDTKTVPLPEAPADSISLPEQVIGQVARQAVSAGAYVPTAAITGGLPGVNIAKQLSPGERAIALQVDQESGVGTLIQTGDRIDVVVGIPKANLPVGFLFPLDANQKTGSDVPKSAQGPAGNQGFQVIPDNAINSTSVKLLVQNVRVVDTILPPVATSAGTAATPAPSGPNVALSAGQELVIVAVSAQQAEVLRYALMEGTIYLALRSPADATASPATTTGIVLRTLIDEYGVLPPRLVVTPNKGQ